MPYYEDQQVRHDRIDEARRNRLLGVRAGPQVAAEPTAIPGFRSGLNVTLDLTGGVDKGVAYLQPGIMAIRGQLARVEDRIPLTESEVEWIRPRAPGQLYYIYLGTDGRPYMDYREPEYDRENFVDHHPQYVTRVVVGVLYVGLQEQVLLAIPGTREPVEPIVASSQFRGLADYYCDAEDDEVQIDAAALYLVQRYATAGAGGQIRLTSGTYILGSDVNLRSPAVQLVGTGRGCILNGRNRRGAEGAVDHRTSPTLVVLGHRGDGSPRTDSDENIRNVLGQWIDAETFYIGPSGSFLEPTEPGQPGEFRVNAKYRLPQLEVGVIRPPEDTPVTGDQRLRTDGKWLQLRRYYGESVGWVAQVSIGSDRRADYGTPDPLTFDPNIPTLAEPILDLISFSNEIRISFLARDHNPRLRFLSSDGRVTEYATNNLRSVSVPEGSNIGQTGFRGPLAARWRYGGDLEVVRDVKSQGGDVKAWQGITAGSGIYNTNPPAGRIQAQENVVAGGDVIAGDDVTAGDDVRAGGDVIAVSHVLAGSVSHATARRRINAGVAASALYVDGPANIDGSITADVRSFTSRSALIAYLRDTLSLGNGQAVQVSGSVLVTNRMFFPSIAWRAGNDYFWSGMSQGFGTGFLNAGQRGNYSNGPYGQNISSRFDSSERMHVTIQAFKG